VNLFYYEVYPPPPPSLPPASFAYVSIPVKYGRLIITGWSIGFAVSEIFSPLALSRLLYDYVINFCIAGSYELIK